MSTGCAFLQYAYHETCNLRGRQEESATCGGNRPGRGPGTERVLDVAGMLGFLRNGTLPRKLKASPWFKTLKAILLASPRAARDMIALLQAGDKFHRALERTARALARAEDGAGKTRLKSLFLPLDRVRLKAPVPHPNKIIAVGLNYADHAAEQGRTPPEKPVYFGIYANAVIGPGEDIELPPNSDQVDWEGELAVVMGRGGRNIPEERTLDYVAGYTVYNDVSARDMQFSDRQYFRGKGCDTFAPMGPWLATTDEVRDPHNLSISLRVNGELMQNSNSSNLVFKIPYLISYLSRAMRWEAGDVLSTGTPGGVGKFRNPPIFLKAGDSVSVTIGKIGTLTNPVVGPRSIDYINGN